MTRFTMPEIALIGQDSENNFNGCNCGIMDQFASAMGRKDHAIFLDTSTLEYQYAPVLLEDAKIVITNSKVKHSLVNSAYNDRRRECETALSDLQTVTQISRLWEISPTRILNPSKSAIKDPVCLKRARHAVHENQRTIQAVEALKNNDIALFGKLMNASHDISARRTMKYPARRSIFWWIWPSPCPASSGPASPAAASAAAPSAS